jgi:hypothetical protein
MKILRNIALAALALLAVLGVGSLVLMPTSNIEVDANGIPHGDAGHNHDEMERLLRERLRLQAEQNPELLAVVSQNSEDAGPPSGSSDAQEEVLVTPSAAAGGVASAAPPAVEAKPRKIEDPAEPPKADEQISVSGCLRGYGTPGQCIPGTFPDALGVSQPTTCAVLVDVFPKGFDAPKDDFAGLDPNGDRIACGAGDN